MLTNWLKRKQTAPAQVLPGVVLHLSGPILDQAHASLRAEAEQIGGVEAVVDALAAKAHFFQSYLGDGAIEHLSEKSLYDLVAFMPSVRRRISADIEKNGIEPVRDALSGLLQDHKEPWQVDKRMTAFVQAFPTDSKHRWVRDFAGEILHYLEPGIYPLMTRWIWDTEANTGVLREIWHDTDGGAGHLDVPDDYQTCLKLRDELVGYALDRGIETDPEFFVDVLCAQIYAGYIASQGASYLKSDFSDPNEQFQYTLRMLGLDIAQMGNRRTKVKLSGKGRHQISDLVELTTEGGVPCQSTKNH